MREENFCPEGHEMSPEITSTLHAPYFYCPTCDFFYVTTLERLTREDVARNFHDPERAERMKQLALRNMNLRRVQYADLVKLGYINDPA